MTLAIVMKLAGLAVFIVGIAVIAIRLLIWAVTER